MKRVLIIDIGNTSISIAGFEKETLLWHFYSDFKLKDLVMFSNSFKSFLEKKKINVKHYSDGIISSVVPDATLLIQKSIEKIFNFDCKILNAKMYMDLVKFDVDNPKEVGQDLVGDIIYATHYLKVPCVVSDLGTATKHIAIDKNKKFIGVSFYPGLQVSLDSLSLSAALIPNIDKINTFSEMFPPKEYFGKNTVDAMLSGIYWSHYSSICECSKKIAEKLGKDTIRIATGGFSNIFKEKLINDGFIFDDSAVLKGINLIYLKNFGE